MSNSVNQTPEELVCEDLICNSIDDICLWVEIYTDLPNDLADENGEIYKYNQKNSFIVICDESSPRGRRASEYVIDFDELDTARNDDNPPAVAIGFMNEQELEWFNNCYHRSKKIKPKLFKEGFVSIMAISDASISIEVSLDCLAPPK